MKHWLSIALAVPIALASVVFAWQNAGLVALDLFGAVWSLPLGVVVLGALLLGCSAGGALLWFAVILPLQLRLRRMLAASEKSSL